MKEDDENYIKIRIAISLSVLLQKNKVHSQEKENKNAIVDSYEKISLNAGIRKATVTSAFNGRTRTAMTTIILIVDALGYTLKDFSEIYDRITAQEISDFSKTKT